MPSAKRIATKPNCIMGISPNAIPTQALLYC